MRQTRDCGDDHKKRILLDTHHSMAFLSLSSYGYLACNSTSMANSIRWDWMKMKQKMRRTIIFVWQILFIISFAFCYCFMMMLMTCRYERRERETNKRFDTLKILHESRWIFPYSVLTMCTTWHHVEWKSSKKNTCQHTLSVTTRSQCALRQVCVLWAVIHFVNISFRTKLNFYWTLG